jgi:acyl-CoA synthetase (NDP forming)
MEFWTELQMASIHKMLNPRSIAIVGATPRMQYGGRFLAAALKAKDRIRVYAVNPRYDEIMGVKSYPSVTNLPEAPDVVAIEVPWDQVLDVLQESHRKGAGSAIVILAGFAERGVEEGVEVIIGVSCDPQLGPVLLFGGGDVMVEVYNDVALRRCPITRAEARAMISEVKGARLLQGFRGLAELDINPLMVLPSGQGVKAVDALVVFRGT